jgi:chorismate synthase
MALRFLTAGESHGPGLTAILDGMPSGLAIDAALVDRELARRQAGYGRGARMRIESDRADFTGGVRHGRTLGSPIAIHIPNLDYDNWREIMAPFGAAPVPARREVTAPRPGHADLAGGAKHGVGDLRDVLERASARETAARVACGAVARQLLATFGVRVASHVRSLGAVVCPVRVPEDCAWSDVADRAAANDLACLDAATYDAMVGAITQAKADGDTLGGVIEAIMLGLPVGLGSHVQWDRKLDGRIGQAMLSIQAVKGVEIGPAFENATLRGSAVHDPVERGADRRLRRTRNRAGGLEGGITNGEPLVVHVAMKPLSTLMRPLATVDLRTGEAARAAVERSDVCAVPACGVVVEAMLTLVLANSFVETFAGDTLDAMRAAYDRHVAEVARWTGSS